MPEWIVLTVVGILFCSSRSRSPTSSSSSAPWTSASSFARAPNTPSPANPFVIFSILLTIWMVCPRSASSSPARDTDAPSTSSSIFGIIALFFAFRFVLSKRLQQKIDQRFFREAYSTEQLLSELSDEARTFTEVSPLLNTITQRIGDTLHVDRIAVFLRSGDTFRSSSPPELRSSRPRLASPSPRPSPPSPRLTRGQPPANVYRDDPSSWLVDATEAERTALADLSTELLVPLPGRNRLARRHALGPKRSEEPYSRTDRQLLQIRRLANRPRPRKR